MLRLFLERTRDLISRLISYGDPSLKPNGSRGESAGEQRSSQIETELLEKLVSKIGQEIGEELARRLGDPVIGPEKRSLQHREPEKDEVGHLREELDQMKERELEYLKTLTKSLSQDVDSLREELRRERTAAANRQVDEQPAKREGKGYARWWIGILVNINGILFGIAASLSLFVTSYVLEDLETETSAAEMRVSEVKEDLETLSVKYAAGVERANRYAEENKGRFDAWSSILRGLVFQVKWENEAEREKYLSVLQEEDDERDLYGSPINDEMRSYPFGQPSTP